MDNYTKRHVLVILYIRVTSAVFLRGGRRVVGAFTPVYPGLNFEICVCLFMYVCLYIYIYIDI